MSRKDAPGITHYDTMGEAIALCDLAQEPRILKSPSGRYCWLPAGLECASLVHNWGYTVERAM